MFKFLLIGLVSVYGGENPLDALSTATWDVNSISAVSKSESDFTLEPDLNDSKYYLHYSNTYKESTGDVPGLQEIIKRLNAQGCLDAKGDLVVLQRSAYVLPVKPELITKEVIGSVKFQNSIFPSVKFLTPKIDEGNRRISQEVPVLGKIEIEYKEEFFDESNFDKYQRELSLPELGQPKLLMQVTNAETKGSGITQGIRLKYFYALPNDLGSLVMEENLSSLDLSQLGFWTRSAISATPNATVAIGLQAVVSTEIRRMNEFFKKKEDETQSN